MKPRLTPAPDSPQVNVRLAKEHRPDGLPRTRFQKQKVAVAKFYRGARIK